MQLDDDDYVTRWKQYWNLVVRSIASRVGAFAGVDQEEVEAYVQHRRLAEFHRTFAQRTPYSGGENGVMVRAHPGWELARVEDRLATEQAVALGLVDPPQVGASPPPSGDDPEEPAVFDGITDDQVGPDGRPL